MTTRAARFAADVQPGDAYDWKQRRIHQIADERDALKRQLRRTRLAAALAVSIITAVAWLGLPAYGWAAVPVLLCIFAGPVALAFVAGLVWEDSRTREDQQR